MPHTSSQPSSSSAPVMAEADNEFDPILLMSYFVRFANALQEDEGTLPADYALKDIDKLKGIRKHLFQRFDKLYKEDPSDKIAMRAWFIALDQQKAAFARDPNNAVMPWRDKALWLKAVEIRPGLVTRSHATYDASEPTMNEIIFEACCFNIVADIQSGMMSNQEEMTSDEAMSIFLREKKYSEFFKSTLKSLLASYCEPDYVFPLKDTHPLIVNINDIVKKIRSYAAYKKAQAGEEYLNEDEVNNILDEAKSKNNEHIKDESHYKILKIKSINNNFLDILFFLIQKQVIEVALKELLELVEAYLMGEKKLESLKSMFSEIKLAQNVIQKYQRYHFDINFTGNPLDDALMIFLCDHLRHSKIGPVLTYTKSDAELSSHRARASLADVRLASSASRATPISEPDPLPDVAWQEVPCWYSAMQSEQANKLLSLAVAQNKPDVITHLRPIADFVAGYTPLHKSIQKNDWAELKRLCLPRRPLTITTEPCPETGEPPKKNPQEGVLYLTEKNGRLRYTTKLATGKVVNVKLSIRIQGPLTPILVNQLRPGIQAIASKKRHDVADMNNDIKICFLEYTPLHMAVIYGRTKMVKFLLQKMRELAEVAARKTEESDPNKFMSGLLDTRTNATYAGRQYTNFHLAVIQGNLELMKVLRAYGADISALSYNSKNTGGYNAFHLAILHNHLDIVKFFRSKSWLGRHKHKTVAVDSDDDLQEHSSQSRFIFDLNATIEEDGLTPLCLASQHGYKDMVALLIESGADPRKPDNAGHTPLYWAIKNRNKAITALLLQAPNIKAESVAIVNLAIQLKDYSLLEQLLQLGISLSKSTFHKSALEEAIAQNNIEAVKLLIRYGADREELNFHGVTLLHKAIQFNTDIEIIKLLVTRSNMNKQDGNFNTPLLSAIKKAIEPNLKNTSGQDPVKVVEYLLRVGCHFNKLTEAEAEAMAKDSIKIEREAELRARARAQLDVTSERFVTKAEREKAIEIMYEILLEIEDFSAEETEAKITKYKTTLMKKVSDNFVNLFDKLIDYAEYTGDLKLFTLLLEHNVNLGINEQPKYNIERMISLFEFHENYDVCKNYMSRNLSYWSGHVKYFFDDDQEKLFASCNIDSSEIYIANNRIIVDYLVENFSSKLEAIFPDFKGDKKASEKISQALSKLNFLLNPKIIENTYLREQALTCLFDMFSDDISDSKKIRLVHAYDLIRNIEKNPTLLKGDNYFSEHDHHQSQTFIIKPELSSLQQANNEIILYHLFSKISVFQKHLQREALPTDFNDDTLRDMSARLNDLGVCLNPKLLISDQFSPESLNDLWRMLHSFAKTEDEEQQAEAVVEKYVQLDEKPRISTAPNHLSFYSAVIIDIVHAGLSGQIPKDSALWQNLVNKLLVKLRADGHIDYEDTDDPQMIMRALLHSFSPGNHTAFIQDTKARQGHWQVLVARCEWLHLQQTCAMYLQRLVAEVLYPDIRMQTAYLQSKPAVGPQEIAAVAHVLGCELQAIAPDSGMTSSVGTGFTLSYEPKHDGYYSARPVADDYAKYMAGEIHKKSDEDVNLDWVDLRVYPGHVNQAHGRPLRVVKGDLHANALNMLYFLVYEGIVNISREDYETFVKLYNGLPDNVRIDDSMLAPLKTIIGKLSMGADAQKSIVFIGDTKCDRGKTDELIDMLFNKLDDLAIDFRIPLSNHDLGHEEFNARLNPGSNIFFGGHGYTFCLLSDIPKGGKPEQGKIYLAIQKDNIEYTVISPEGHIVSSQMRLSEFGRWGQNKVTKTELSMLTDAYLEKHVEKIITHQAEVKMLREEINNTSDLSQKAALSARENEHLSTLRSMRATLKTLKAVRSQLIERSTANQHIYPQIPQKKENDDSYQSCGFAITAANFDTASLVSIGSQGGQTQSLATFKRSGFETVLRKTRDSQQGYVKHRCLLDYAWDEATQQLHLYAHAPIGIDAIQAVAKKLGVAFAFSLEDPKPLMETIERINAHAKKNWQQLIELCVKEIMEIASGDDSEAAKRYHIDKWPLSALLWTRLSAARARNMLGVESLNPAGITYGVVCHAGHDGDVGNVDAKDRRCLNSKLGTRASSGNTIEWEAFMQGPVGTSAVGYTHIAPAPDLELESDAIMEDDVIQALEMPSEDLSPTAPDDAMQAEPAPQTKTLTDYLPSFLKTLFTEPSQQDEPTTSSTADVATQTDSTNSTSDESMLVDAPADDAHARDIATQAAAAVSQKRGPVRDNPETQHSQETRPTPNAAAEQPVPHEPESTQAQRQHSSLLAAASRPQTEAALSDLSHNHHALFGQHVDSHPQAPLSFGSEQEMLAAARHYVQAKVHPAPEAHTTSLPIVNQPREHRNQLEWDVGVGEHRHRVQVQTEQTAVSHKLSAQGGVDDLEARIRALAELASRVDSDYLGRHIASQAAFVGVRLIEGSVLESPPALATAVSIMLWQKVLPVMDAAHWQTVFDYMRTHSEDALRDTTATLRTMLADAGRIQAEHGRRVQRYQLNFFEQHMPLRNFEEIVVRAAAPSA